MELFKLIPLIGISALMSGCQPKLKIFSVTFKCEDRIMQKDENVVEGTTPVYNGETPIKQNRIPVIKDYIFNGWDKELKPIHEDTIFNAVFLESEAAALALGFNCNDEHNVLTISNQNTKIDWSDDSKDDKELSHNFSKDGDYIVRIFTDNLGSFRIDDGLSGVTSLYFSDDVTKISPNGFKNCDNIKFLRLPDNLNDLNAYMFSNSNPSFYKIIDDVYYLGNENNDHLYCFGTTNNEEIHIADGCKYLTKNSFSSSTETKLLTLPNSLINIGDNALTKCALLESISIPNNVEYIGKYAFENCYQLSSINIPNKVKIINESTFENCLSLESISIPNCIEEIDDNAFYACTNLSYVDLSNVDHLIKSGVDMFTGCSKNLEIRVKNHNLKSDYENDKNWQQYNIVCPF